VKGLKIRDAGPQDKTAVLEFCKQTWPEYGDYVQRVWDTWFADAGGRLITAELHGIPVGIAKITDFGQGEIWLEGLRVDAGHRGKGIANAINLEVLRTLRRMKRGKARFCTGADNWGSRRIATKFGFRVAARFRYYWRKSRKGIMAGRFVRPREMRRVYDYILSSKFLRMSSGLIAEGWIFRELSRALIRGYVGKKRVVIVEESGQPLGLAIYPYEAAERTLTLGFVDGYPRAMKVLLRNCLYIAQAQGYKYCSVAVPSKYYSRLAEQVGFKRKDSVGQMVFEHSLAGIPHLETRKHR
jgi:RimJ/RimL family protein N-acetyltransferase